jgi:hypothetical protein
MSCHTQKDGQVSVDEFKLAVKNSCIGKKYNEFPPAMRVFIDSTFKSLDINGEFRQSWDGRVSSSC